MLKSASKKLNRTQEKLRRNIAKDEKTVKDEKFERLHADFQKQMKFAKNLLSESKKYMAAVREMSTIHKQYFGFLVENFEQFLGEDNNEVFNEQKVSIDESWQGYSKKLSNNFTMSIAKYCEEFDSKNHKLKKRSNKLLDLQIAKRNKQNLSDKGQDISKAEEAVELASISFRAVDHEIKSDLPMFYQDRIEFLTNLFAEFFKSSHCMFDDLAKSCKEMGNVVREIHDEYSTDKSQSPERKSTIRSNVSYEGKATLESTSSIHSAPTEFTDLTNERTESYSNKDTESLSDRSETHTYEFPESITQRARSQGDDNIELISNRSDSCKSESQVHDKSVESISYSSESQKGEASEITQPKPDAQSDANVLLHIEEDKQSELRKDDSSEIICSKSDVHSDANIVLQGQEDEKSSEISESKSIEVLTPNSNEGKLGSVENTDEFSNKNPKTSDEDHKACNVNSDESMEASKKDINRSTEALEKANESDEYHSSEDLSVDSTEIKK